MALQELNFIDVDKPDQDYRSRLIYLLEQDLDCVYHFALNELKEVIEGLNNQDQLDMLLTMIEGRRLRDISDLHFDLAT